MGCNMSCTFCQNASLSQPPRLGGRITGHLASPADLVAAALDSGCKSISYTYTEPTIFFELVEDTARLAQARGLKNILVTNGFMSPDCLDALGLQWRAMGMGPHPLLDVEQMSLPLAQGWNLLSLPFPGTTPQLFADILDTLSIAWALDAGVAPAGKWRSFSPDVPPFLNDLTVIDQTMGFFLFMDQADTLSVSGVAPPLATDIPLAGGRFNLVSYPARAVRPVTEVLAGVAFSIVCTYDSQDQADPWKCFDPDVPPFLNDLAQMEPGRGYFIFPEADATLHVPG
jgi:hypothetical protein